MALTRTQRWLHRPVGGAAGSTPSTRAPSRERGGEPDRATAPATGTAGWGPRTSGTTGSWAARPSGAATPAAPPAAPAPATAGPARARGAAGVDDAASRNLAAWRRELTRSTGTAGGVCLTERPARSDLPTDGGVLSAAPGGGLNLHPGTARLRDLTPFQPREGGGRPETTMLVYTNGIRVDAPAQARELQAIADRTGIPVIGIRDATQGAAADTAQIGDDRAPGSRSAPPAPPAGAASRWLRR